MTRLCSLLISFFLALSTGASAAATVDTSAWICEFCPFQQGTVVENRFGVTSVSDDAAILGNGTGLDEEGIYANIETRGSDMASGRFLRWNVEDLGLDSRAVNIEGGKAGQFDYHIDWTELPYRQFFTSATVFTEGSDGSLVLPEDWVTAPTTAGFTALGDNLLNRAIESDRQTLDLGGQYHLSERMSVSADYRQRNNEGVRLIGGPTYSNASQLPAPIDHRTDELELGIRYGSDQAFLGLSWYLSDFDNKYQSLSWEQPFSTAPGAGTPELARPPDNRFQQLRLSGGYAFSPWNTVLNLTAAIGQIEQDANFLPYTTNPDLVPPALPQDSLNGEVDTTNIALLANARPLSKLRLRVTYRYDERDNNTPVTTFSRVIVDTFLSGEAEMNRPYSYKRRKYSGVADWDMLKQLRLSAGFEFKDYDRTLQEVSNQEEFLSYGRARWRPFTSIELDGRYGNSRREIDNYDELLAIAQGQNPLLRKYNLAFRFRDFVDMRANWTPSDMPIAISVTALFADDSYTQSQLGLTEGEERSYSADFNWFLSDSASLFINGGVDSLKADQLGSESFGAPDWLATNNDRFTSWGGGVNVEGIRDKLDLRLSVIRTRGESEISIDSASAGFDQFPDLDTELDRLRLDLRYAYTETMDITFGATYQRFKSADWALQGLRPDALPQLFALGAEPYDEENLIIAIGIRYRMGP